MKVRFLTSLAGAREAYDFGEVADLPAEKAKPWIASGICELVKEGDESRPAKEIEAAADRVSLEMAVIRRSRRTERP